MNRMIPPLVSRIIEEASASAGAKISPFWQSASERVPEEGMYQLAAGLDVKNPEQLFNQLPSGYRVVYSIFMWEQSRAGEGFKTGTDNAGQSLVHAAADCYDLVGMPDEAGALRRMLVQYASTPLDYARIEAEYAALPNPYRDDWDRIPYLVRHLCVNADRYFYAEA